MDNDAVLRKRAAHLLKKLPIFFGLDDEEYSQLVRICHSGEYQAEETIFAEGDYSDCIFVILTGKVVISSQRCALMTTLGVGDIFGEIGVICQVHRTADARAAEHTLVLTIDKDDLAFLLGRCSRMSSVLMRNLAQVLAERLVQKNRETSVYFS